MLLISIGNLINLQCSSDADSMHHPITNTFPMESICQITDFHLQCSPVSPPSKLRCGISLIDFRSLATWNNRIRMHPQRGREGVTMRESKQTARICCRNTKQTLTWFTLGSVQMTHMWWKVHVTEVTLALSNITSAGQGKTVRANWTAAERRNTFHCSNTAVRMGFITHAFWI